MRACSRYSRTQSSGDETAFMIALPFWFEDDVDRCPECDSRRIFRWFSTSNERRDFMECKRCHHRWTVR